MAVVRRLGAAEDLATPGAAGQFAGDGVDELVVRREWPSGSLVFDSSKPPLAGGDQGGWRLRWIGSVEGGFDE